MKAIDASQLIINKLSRMGQSIDRSDLTKMLYLLDLTIQKLTTTIQLRMKFSIDAESYLNWVRLE